MRRKIVAANWKMNMTGETAHNFFSQLNQMTWPDDVDAIVAPPNLYLQGLHSIKEMLNFVVKTVIRSKVGLIRVKCLPPCYQMQGPVIV